MIKKFYKLVINNYLIRNQNEHNKTITNEKNSWIIRDKVSTYTIQIVKEEYEYYLRLTPYHNSYFETRLNIKNILFKTKMVMFAIKENEQLYS